MRVSELMTANVETCSVHDTVNRAAQIMWEADVGTVPVLEGPRVVGMITDRDVCMATYTKGRSPAQIPVTNAMSHHVISCRPDDKLTDAVALMREHRVRRLPVIDGMGVLVGILSINDLARLAMTETEQPAHRLRSDQLVRTLGSICEARSTARIMNPVLPPRSMEPVILATH